MHKENEMRNLPDKKGYAKHVKCLGDELYAVEHVRTDAGNAAVDALEEER